VGIYGSEEEKLRADRRWAVLGGAERAVSKYAQTTYIPSSRTLFSPVGSGVVVVSSRTGDAPSACVRSVQRTVYVMMLVVAIVGRTAGKLTTTPGRPKPPI